MALAVLLAAAVTLGALLYVARPLLGKPVPPPDPHADGRAGRLALVEERDRALAALKELEFDHRTGKISDRDYGEQVGPLRRRAVETLRALEPEASPVRPARIRRRVGDRAKVGS